MKHRSKPIFTLLAIFTLAGAPLHADDGNQLIIELETDSFKFGPTDVSSLAIGEVKTIETESGAVIDILRTMDELEIYVDGELLSPGFDHDPNLTLHTIKNHVTIICDEDDDHDCENHFLIHTQGDENMTTRINRDSHEVIDIEEIEVICIDEGEETSCASHVVQVGGDGVMNIPSSHQEHIDAEGHKVISIRVEADSND